MAKNYKLYNFLVNNYGLSKEKVMEHFEDRIEQIVHKSLSSKWNSNYLEGIIMNALTKLFEGKSNINFQQHWHSSDTFVNYFKKRVDELIREKLNKDFEFKIELKKKEVPNEVSSTEPAPTITDDSLSKSEADNFHCSITYDVCTEPCDVKRVRVAKVVRK